MGRVALSSGRFRRIGGDGSPSGRLSQRASGSPIQTLNPAEWDRAPRWTVTVLPPSQDQLDEGLHAACQLGGFTSEQTDEILEGVDITEGNADEHVLAYVSGGTTIYVNPNGTGGSIPSTDPNVGALLAPILLHEIYHLDPSPDGPGPPGAGVDAESCAHIGLQAFGAQLAADQANAATDPAIVAQLCQLARDMAGPLEIGNSMGNRARDCELDNDTGGPGPPTPGNNFGWDYPPFDQINFGDCP